MILVLLAGHAFATSVVRPPEPCSASTVYALRHQQERQALVHGDLEWLPEPNDCGMRPLSEEYEDLDAFDEGLARLLGSLEAASAIVALQHPTLIPSMEGYERVVGQYRDASPEDPEVPESLRDYLRAWRWRERHPCFHRDMPRAPWGWDRNRLQSDRSDVVPLQCVMTTEAWMYPENSRLTPVSVTWTFSAGFVGATRLPSTPDTRPEGD